MITAEALEIILNMAKSTAGSKSKSGQEAIKEVESLLESYEDDDYEDDDYVKNHGGFR